MAVDQEASETEPAHGGATDGSPSAPDVVDFDALNAALGSLSVPVAGGSTPQLADSEGRSSATYSSARPHAIPQTRAPAAEELNAPAVIIAQPEETVPTGPPNMTVPMAPPHNGQHHGPTGPAFQTEPYVAHAHAPPEHIGRTVPLAQAQAQPQRPRRPRTPTIVVRARGPSRTKKALVFVFLLVIFVVGGATLLLFKTPLGMSAPAIPSLRK